MTGNEQPTKIGQAPLTEDEVSRVTVGNQHTDTFSICAWQVMKAAAIHYGVNDWISHVDSALTYEENVAVMRKAGVSREHGLAQSMNELRGKDVIRTGDY